MQLSDVELRDMGHAGYRSAVQFSARSNGEKNFLKGVKAVREIVKLEEKAKSGANLEAGQRTKLAGKARALSTLAELGTLLAPASDLREKNADVLALLEQ